MFDFLKLSYSVENTEPLFYSFDFTNRVNRNTGELSSYAECEYRGVTIKVFDKGFVLILGSVHKYLNDGNNYNDFTLMDFIEAVNELSGNLNYNLWYAKPDTVEVGVNIEPPIQTKKILRYSLVHGNKQLKDVPVKNSGDYRQVERQQYIIKLYDKGKQYNLNNDLLRFEIKLMSGMLRRLELNHLYDFLRPDMTKNLGELLIKEFNEILFADPTIDKKKLKGKQLQQLDRWRNKDYWMELYEGVTSTNKNKPVREKDRFRKLIDQNSDRIQDETSNRISKKWGILSDYSETDIISKLGNFNTSIIEIVFPNKRICPVTSLDMSMQRVNSTFLSFSGIRYYFENNKEIQNELLLRLSDKWKDSPCDVQIREIAHSIRNEYYNPKHNTLRRIQRIEDYPLLFEVRTIVDPKFLEIAGY